MSYEDNVSGPVLEAEVAAFLEGWPDKRQYVSLSMASAAISGRSLQTYELRVLWPDCDSETKRNIRAILDSFLYRDFETLTATERDIIWRGLRLYLDLPAEAFPYPETFLALDRVQPPLWRWSDKPSFRLLALVVFLGSLAVGCLSGYVITRIVEPARQPLAADRSPPALSAPLYVPPAPPPVFRSR